MKCRKCGSEISEGSKFCPVCGAPVETTQAKKKQRIDLKTPKGKKTAVIAGVVTAAVIIGIAAIVTRSTPISVTEGYQPVFTGGNGYGSVEVPDNLPLSDKNQAEKDFENEFEKETGGALNYLFSGGSSAKGDGRKAQAMYQMADSLSCRWEDENGNKLKQGKLKNGQKIVYACTYNQNAGRQAGYRYTDLKTTYTVKGLKKVKEIDPFENVSAEWKLGGYDITPDISFKDGSIQKKLSDKNLLNYYIDQTGDTGAEIKVDYDEDKLTKEGYHVKEKSPAKTFDLGEKPVEITNTSDAEALKAAQKVTDPLIQKDIENCGNTLSEETYDSDSDTPLTIPENGYKVKGLDEDWGIMKVDYDVTAGNLIFERSYGVRVYKMSDGSYKAVSTDSDDDSVDCQVYVNEYSDTQEW